MKHKYLHKDYIDFTTTEVSVKRIKSIIMAQLLA